VLQEHAWPGNVRELRLAIERAGCLVENGTLPPGAVREAIALGMPRATRGDRRASERRGKAADRRTRAKPRRSLDDLLILCETNGWDAVRVAESLGIARSTLYDRLKAAGISLRALRKSGNPEFHRNSTGIPENGTEQIT
jgi:DNA-binding NtrC family response regulator